MQCAGLTESTMCTVGQTAKSIQPQHDALVLSLHSPHEAAKAHRTHGELRERNRRVLSPCGLDQGRQLLSLVLMTRASANLCEFIDGKFRASYHDSANDPQIVVTEIFTLQIITVP